MSATLGAKAAVELLRWLNRMPQFAHYQIGDLSPDVFCETLEDLPITLDFAKDACESLLATADRVMPSAQALRRRMMEHAGLLAPSWAAAQLTILEARRTGGSLRSFPGPVAQAVEAKGGMAALNASENQEAAFAQLRELYTECARRHDRFVLEPGGLEAFVAVCEWVAAERAEIDLVANGRWAAGVLGWDAFGARGVPETVEGCAEAFREYQERFGEDPVKPPPELDRGRPELQPPLSPKVRAMLAGGWQRAKQVEAPRG